MTASTIASILLVITTPVLSQAIPKIGPCPAGYGTSGGYCVPSSRTAPPRPVVEKVGPCPAGYDTSGSYCVGSNANARHVVVRTGPCPAGYGTSGAYCLSSR